jgi:TorA maturation chaperone TorD
MPDISSLALAREEAYRLLAACYYIPDQLLFEERPWVSLAGLLLKLSKEASEQARLMEPAAVGDVESLKVEYARLFMGPFTLIAPPYGSVYLDAGRTVMGESTVRIAEYYRKHGFVLGEDIREPADHIAIELEFMSLLAFRQRESEGSGDMDAVRHSIAAQHDFLRVFLLPFLKPFAKAVYEDDEAPFYSALARCTAAFAEDDAAVVGSILK